jgi:transcriptional regulator with XRE-family HTH domain
MMNILIIGEQIARGRKEKNLTQEDLAFELDVPPQAVSKWETGKSLPDVYTLVKLAEIFGVYDLGYFVGEPCENFTTMEEFVDYWSSLSLEGLREIAKKYDVKYAEKDDKAKLVAKLTAGMEKYC